MKPTYITFALATMVSFAAYAAPVTRNAALYAADKFRSSRGIVRHDGSKPIKQTRGANAESGYAPYHIINYSGNAGYVVIAGDDRARTVLAYSDSGNLDPETLPAACKEWLGMYARQIESLPSSSSMIESGGLNYSTQAVEPMLKSRWGQNAPYNLDCPIDKSSGLRCVTGCVATATAQIMYFYKFPQSPSGSIIYQDNKQETTRTLDFSTIGKFEWDKMTDSYNESIPEESRQAVASLMKAVGYATQMQYSSDVSLTNHRSAGTALMNYFGYDTNMHLYERHLITDQKWVDLLTTELQEGRPVLYDGKNGQMGHTFICDGYDGNGMFHFNWGWDGLSDGYYSLSALNPSKQSTGGSDQGYTNGQSMTCRIAPAGSIAPLQQDSALIAIATLYFQDSHAFHEAKKIKTLSTALSAAHLFFYVINTGLREFDGEVWAVEEKDGKSTPIIAGTAVQGQNYTGYSFPLSTLSSGTHRISFRYRLPGSGALYPLLADLTSPSGCTADVNGEDVCLSIEQYPQLVLTPNTNSFFMMTTSQQSLDVTVTSLGSESWSGNILATISHDNGLEFPGILKGEVNIGGNSSANVTLTAYGLELEKGTHRINFHTGDERRKLVTSQPIFITEGSGIIDPQAGEGISIKADNARIHIHTDEALLEARVTDISGRNIILIHNTPEGESICTPPLPSGVYLISLRTLSNRPIIKKILITDARI